MIHSQLSKGRTREICSRVWHSVSFWHMVYRFCLFSVQFSSVTQSCPTLCNPMNCSTPGLPVHHQLPEFSQTHIHWVGDAIQPSHPLLSPSPPAPNPSQHQSLFQWVNSSHEVAKVIFRSIHIAANGSYSVLFYDWVISHCICVLCLLYPFLCGHLDHGWSFSLLPCLGSCQ